MENAAKSVTSSTVFPVSDSAMLWGFSSDLIEFSIAALVVVLGLTFHTLSTNRKAQKKTAQKLGSCAGWVDNRGAGSSAVRQPNSSGLGKTASKQNNKKSKQPLVTKQTNPREIFIMSPGLLKKDGLDPDLPPEPAGSSASTVCGESSEDEALGKKNVSDDESETEKGTPNLLDALPMTPPPPLKKGPGPPKPPGLAMPPPGLTAPLAPTKQAMPTSLSAGSQNLLALLREERAKKAAEKTTANKVDEEGVPAATTVPPWRQNRPPSPEDKILVSLRRMSGESKEDGGESKVPEWRRQA